MKTRSTNSSTSSNIDNSLNVSLTKLSNSFNGIIHTNAFKKSFGAVKKLLENSPTKINSSEKLYYNFVKNTSFLSKEITKQLFECSGKDDNLFYESIEEIEDPHFFNTEKMPKELFINTKNYAKNKIISSVDYLNMKKQIFKEKTSPDSIQKYFIENKSSYQFDHYDTDGYSTYFKKLAFNKAVDYTFPLISKAICELEKFRKNVFTNVKSSTMDYLTPENLAYLWMHQPEFRKYLSQRKEQFSRLYYFYTDFRGEGKKSLKKAMDMDSFNKVYKHTSRLDGSILSPIDKLSHGTNIIYDLSVNFMAEKLGVALAMTGIWNLPPIRKKTNFTMNRLFPKDKFYGRRMQSLPVRFAITKKISRLYGNPLVFSMMVSYLISMSIAKSIQDGEKLEEIDPEIYAILKKQNREYVNSSLHFQLIESAKSTSTKS